MIFDGVRPIDTVEFGLQKALNASRLSAVSNFLSYVVRRFRVALGLFLECSALSSC